MPLGIRLRSVVVSTVGSTWEMETKIAFFSTTQCAWPFPIIQTVRSPVNRRSPLSLAKSKSKTTSHTLHACGKSNSHQHEQLRFNLPVILIWSIITNAVMIESTFSLVLLMVIINVRVDSADLKVLYHYFYFWLNLTRIWWIPMGWFQA